MSWMQTVASKYRLILVLVILDVYVGLSIHWRQTEFLYMSVSYQVDSI